MRLRAGPAEAIVQILPGFGLTHSGEDIAIASPRRLALADLPIYARVDHLDASPACAPAAADSLHGHDEPPSGGAFASLPPSPAAPAGTAVARMRLQPMSSSRA